MEKIHIIARFKVTPDKISDIKTIAENCIGLTKNEEGAVTYDFFVDEINGNCTAIETYQNSEAVLAHLGNVNEELIKLMEISEFTVEVFGDVSDVLNGALKEKGISPVPYFNGI